MQATQHTQNSHFYDRLTNYKTIKNYKTCWVIYLNKVKIAKKEAHVFPDYTKETHVPNEGEG